MPRDWDQHYSNAADLDWTPDPLVVQVAGLLPPGRALDIASGPGRNALHLAKLAWEVTAVDSSAAAIGILRQRAAGLRVDARVADLEAGQFPIAAESYDLICDVNYLQRDLFQQIREGVRMGGVFAGAIRLTGNPAFVMQPGELRREFAGWKIHYYSEARGSARIIARRA